MGEVYRAIDTRLQRRVAIKVLPEELTSSVVATERFQREARTGSILNHPNICTIYDVGVAPPPFIAMELLEGESLQQRLLRGRMDVPSLVTMAIAVCDGLVAAHSHGFIHRDIKPANLFLTPHGPKLLDFGLAKTHLAGRGGSLGIEPTKSAEALLTGAGETVGTIAYMSPEQLRGVELDARTDVFSFGLVLYEMTTGQPAFRGKTSAAVSGAILYEHPVPPREIVPEIPAQLDAVILKTLEKDRDDRCQTVADLRADLRRLKRELGSQPSHAAAESVDGSRRNEVPKSGPPSDTSVLLGLVGRHRGGLVAVGALVLGLIVFATYFRSTVVEPNPPQFPLSIERVRVDQLTSSGDAERPAIAPDGKYMAYIRRQRGEYSLHVRQTGTAATVEIVPAEPGLVLFGATVSPDSGSVDYVRRMQGQAFELWRVPFLGGVPKRVLDRVNSPIGWSPDGRRFAFIRADASRGSTSVVIVDSDGTGERVLAERHRPAQFVSLMIFTRPSIAPVWSRSGRLLAIPGAGSGADPTDGDVTFIDVDTGAQRTAALPSSVVRGLVWFDDRTLILNAAEPDRPQQLHQLAYPSGQLAPLTRDVNDYDGISLAADGRTLIAARRERRTELAIIDTAGRTVTPGPSIDVTSLRTRLTHINWVGDMVLYENWAWVPGSPPRQFVQDAPASASALDGKTLVFTSGDGLWKTDIDGGPRTLLVSGETWGPTITPDGEWVIFLSSRTGLQSPWIVSMKGGEPRQLVNRFAGPGVDVSPDGKSLLFASRDEVNSRGVAITCDRDGCGNLRIHPNLGLTRLRWTPDGRGITYVDEAAQMNLWTVPVAGGLATQLTRFEDRTIVDFDWAPDGKKLVVARQMETSDVVALHGLQGDTPR